MVKYTKTVTYSRYEDDITISLNYSDGSRVGEFSIVDTEYGFQLQAYHNSWKIFNGCNDVFELLSKESMFGVNMKLLAEMIKDIGYELVIK